MCQQLAMKQELVLIDKTQHSLWQSWLPAWETEWFCLIHIHLSRFCHEVFSSFVDAFNELQLSARIQVSNHQIWDNLNQDSDSNMHLNN